MLRPIVVAPRIPALLRHPIAAGLAYGLLLWIIMYWIVKPLRWPEAPLPSTLYGISNAFFSHCILVGLPIALIAARHFRREAQRRLAAMGGPCRAWRRRRVADSIDSPFSLLGSCL